MDKPSSTHADPYKVAETFIDTIVARVRQPLNFDREMAGARAELAREDLDLARRELAKSGLELEGMNALAEKRSELHRQLAKQAHRRAVDASAAAAQQLAELTPVLPINPFDTSVDEVTFIRSFAGEGVLYDSNISPGDNWARYQLDGSGDAIGGSGTGRLSFFTLWRNPDNRPVILQAGANLIVNANLAAHADFNGIAAWFISDSDAQATVRARTTVWSMDSSVSAIVQDQVLAQLAAHGGFFGDDESASIEFNNMLMASGVVVPAKAYVLIEIELLTDWTALDGSIRLDAQSGAFKVTVPALSLTVT